MRLFYSTCPAGLEEAVKRLAAAKVPGFSAKAVYSGAILYAARTDRPECAGFTNTYIQIARLDKCSSVLHGARMFLVDRKALAEAERTMRDYSFESFRVMFSEQNKLVSVEKEYRIAYEQAIRVRSNRETPDTELTLLRRSNGNCLMLLRLTRPAKAKSGELSPSVAACMAYLARPEEGGRFIDPFAGSGAIGVARMALGKTRRLFLSDIDSATVAKLRKRIPGRAEIEQLDALRMTERFDGGDFTEMATDPPWGLYKPLEMDPKEFCKRLIANISHVMAPYGISVVLTALKNEFAYAADKSDMEVLERFDILVNGKKAAIFVMRK